MDPKRRPADSPKPAPGVAVAVQPPGSSGSEERDGRRPLVDGPPQTASVDDLEEKATDIWAPAVSLFDGKPRQVEPEDADTEFDPGRSGEYRRDRAADLAARAPAGGPRAPAIGSDPEHPSATGADTGADRDTGTDSAADLDRRPRPGPDTDTDTDTEIDTEIDTDIGARPLPSAEPATADAPRSTGPISGKLEVKELLTAVEDGAAARGARPSESVELNGDLGEAARRLAEEPEHERDHEHDRDHERDHAHAHERARGAREPSATVVVSVPRAAPRLTHECRICGRKITAPRPLHFRGARRRDLGFRCEKCSNVFCAAHVVRVSGLLESLFRQGRFHCVLCMPAAQPKNSGK